MLGGSQVATRPAAVDESPVATWPAFRATHHQNTPNHDAQYTYIRGACETYGCTSRGRLVASLCSNTRVAAFVRRRACCAGGRGVQIRVVASMHSICVRDGRLGFGCAMSDACGRMTIVYFVRFERARRNVSLFSMCVLWYLYA